VCDRRRKRRVRAGYWIDWDEVDGVKKRVGSRDKVKHVERNDPVIRSEDDVDGREKSDKKTKSECRK